MLPLSNKSLKKSRKPKARDHQISGKHVTLKFHFPNSKSSQRAVTQISNSCANITHQGNTDGGFRGPGWASRVRGWEFSDAAGAGAGFGVGLYHSITAISYKIGYFEGNYYTNTEIYNYNLTTASNWWDTLLFSSSKNRSSSPKTFSLRLLSWVPLISGVVAVNSNKFLKTWRLESI